MDAEALRAHRCRFDLARLSRAGLDALDALRLEALLAPPLEALAAPQVVQALDLVDRAGAPPALFSYFLPAVLRRPPLGDARAGETLLGGLLASADDPTVAAWDPWIEETLAGWLATRPLRGGDDPVDLWLSESAERQRSLEEGRRLPGILPRRAGLLSDWVTATGGPFYARVALLLLRRWPAAAERRLLLWEAGSADNLLRAWVEVVFHAVGEGWRPGPGPLDALLGAPARRAVAEGLVDHPEPDIALGAAAIAILLAPERGREMRARVARRLADLDASDDDRFVLGSRVRRLLDRA